MQRFRILFVDREAALRELLQDALQQAGHTVSIAEDARQALSRLEAQPFDIVCTGERLGYGISGQELCHTIAKTYPSVGLVFASGFPASIEPLPLKAVYLAKPYRVAQLIRAIEQSNSNAAHDAS